MACGRDAKYLEMAIAMLFLFIYFCPVKKKDRYADT